MSPFGIFIYSNVFVKKKKKKVLNICLNVLFLFTEWKKYYRKLDFSYILFALNIKIYLSVSYLGFLTLQYIT